MASQLNVHHDEGNKWNPESWNISWDDAVSPRPVTDFLLERNINGRLSATIAFDKQYSRGNLEQRAANLIDQGNIFRYEIKQSPHPNLFTLHINDAQPGDLAKMAGALATDADLGQGRTEYALLDKETAIELADIEHNILGESAFGVVRERLSNHQKDYLTYINHIPGAIVTKLEQDGVSAEIDGKAVSAEKTNIFCEPGNESPILAALQKLNADFQQEGAIRVNEPIHEVSRALMIAGLIPETASAKLNEVFPEIRPTFARVSDVGADMASNIPAGPAKTL